MTCEVAVAGRMAGAAPVWDISSSTLLWVERDGDAVHRFLPTTRSDPRPRLDAVPEQRSTPGIDESLGLPQPVAAAHPRRGGGLVLTLRDGVALLDSDGTRRWLVYWARDGVTGAAAAVDQAGRLWVAIAGDGTLLRVAPDGALAVVSQGRDISGIAFSPDATTIYLIDVAAEQLTAADFDPASGQIGLPHPVCPVPGGTGALCVDADGWLWIAPATGTEVHRYRPDGTLDHQLPLCTPPTGCAFGGIQLATLYVTAAPPHAHSAGPLLLVPAAGTGLPTPLFAG